jgi:anti-sigma regulatory factor (Ser/Thr protein kinase)
MVEGGTDLRLTVAVEPAAPRTVRHALHAVDQVADGMRQDLELLVTELVTNVVRHAGLGPEDFMEVAVRVEPGFVRAEVRDPGWGWHAPRCESPRPDDHGGGYGLYLVREIASRWGIDDGVGTTVWFELGGTNGAEFGT